MNNAVSLVPCGDYDIQKVKKALLDSLAPIGGLDWIKPGMKIAVKANLMMRCRPEKCATVHPGFAAALCEILTEKNAKVVVGDSPGGPFTAAYLHAVYSGTGMNQILGSGAELNGDFTYLDVSNPDAVVAKEFQVTKYLTEADAIIDLCKVKTHGLMAYTGACKNLFGAVPGMRKSEYHYKYPSHESFAHMLVDICEWCKPRLSIADAIMVMEGNGPSGGTPRFMGAVIASANPHALDLAAAHLMNLRAEDVPTLRAARERGLIPAAASGLRIFGDLERYVIPDFKLIPKQDVRLWGSTNKTAARLLTRMFAGRPQIDRDACVGCAECMKICPAKAIRMVRQTARISTRKCVCCLCCQEFCPKGVISVRRPLVARLIDAQNKRDVHP